MLSNGRTAIDGRSESAGFGFCVSRGGFTTIGAPHLVERDPVNPDRSRNVFDGLLAHVLEAEAQLVSHLVVDIARNQNAARLSERLQPCRDVDAVAIDIVAVADDVADINTDTELNAALGWHLGVTLGHTALDFDGAAHSIDNTDEFHQHPVAGGLDDPAAMFGDLGIDQCFSKGFEGSEGALLVGDTSIGYSQPYRPRK